MIQLTGTYDNVTKTCDRYDYGTSENEVKEDPGDTNPFRCFRECLIRNPGCNPNAGKAAKEAKFTFE